MRSTIVKQGPIVFLRDVLFMEILAIGLLYIASFVENYEMLYRGWQLDQYIRYDHFIIMASGLFQLVYIVLLFLNWYFSYFELREREIIKKSGILYQTKKSYLLSDIVSVETHQSPLDRFINHATITLEYKNGRSVKMHNIPNFADYVYLIKQSIGDSDTNNTDIEKIIARGESEHIEFKESLRYDTRSKNPNKDLERVVAKTIVGFLNSNGGLLVIGVSDKKIVKGLEDDYMSLPQKNRDGFENHLNLIIRNMIGIQFSKFISITFHKISNNDVCVVIVKKSRRPAYLKFNGKSEEFFIRVGNATHPLSMSEAEDYIKNNFS